MSDVINQKSIDFAVPDSVDYWAVAGALADKMDRLSSQIHGHRQVTDVTLHAVDGVIFSGSDIQVEREALANAGKEADYAYIVGGVRQRRRSRSREIVRYSIHAMSRHSLLKVKVAAFDEITATGLSESVQNFLESIRSTPNQVLDAEKQAYEASRQEGPWKKLIRRTWRERTWIAIWGIVVAVIGGIIKTVWFS